MKDAGSRDNEHDTATRGDASEFTVRPLPLGHRLGELQLDEVLGIGGFGIVYRAFDRTLRRAVAIKEYMPSMLATRGGDYTVSLRSERFAQAFDAGRGAFLNEARLLAQFDHPGLVKVLHFWESHGTAYMVMPFYEGRTLKQLLDGGMRISETQLRNIVGALLGALDTLHRAQCFHRDVALDNVLIRPNGSAILLDFGAARKRIGDLVDDGAMMIKPGYAPIEQYTDDPAFSQGPWTDLYALGAVMHAMITGELPPAAVVRSIKDTYRPLASRELPAGEVYSPAFLAAVDHALQLRIPDRPESVAAFAAELGLRDFGTGGGYGAAVVPPVSDAGRSGEGKPEASAASGTASAAAAASIGASGTASGNAAPDGRASTPAGAEHRSTPTHTASASSGVSGAKPEADAPPASKTVVQGAAVAAAGSLAASAASHVSQPAAKPVEKPVEPDASSGNVERAKEAPAARTDTHDEAGTRSATTDTDIGARGEAGSWNANASAAAGTAGTTAPYAAASASSSGGASVPTGARRGQASAGSRNRRLPVYVGSALVALIAVGLAATYLSRPARVTDEAAPVASQPQAGTPPPASTPAATLAQQGPTPTVVPPSSLAAGSSAQVPPPPVAAEPASARAVEAATPAPQVATTVTSPAPSPSGASSAIAPAGSLDSSERVVNVSPSQEAAAPTVKPTPAQKPQPETDTAIAAVNVLPAEPQPRPPKTQETVQVRFNVRPWGDVYVNGARRGASPPLRSVSLTPGVYVIEIRNGALPPLHRTVAIDFGSKPVNIDYAFE
ncbi:serine/threonine-protein kinase [Burkholderia lata]|uniref:non-specific serine/threonine protein kinase n=1 Tax=Burkholderia lata (strain ATCC 17760 / DSM 23089 / LMG 22485 / NCIMB 9086 / R18194 / 383) TaxID=482957 RepID=A0A6P2T0E1_BURL3|nr:serine/threonine-protein kinase [Burkholderia lata]VWC50896.1 serine/threonine protein kinase [Burkholderia lata]